MTGEGWRPVEARASPGPCRRRCSGRRRRRGRLRGRQGRRRSARHPPRRRCPPCVARRLTPGIGTMSSPWASSQARAIWARLTPCRSATARIASTIFEVRAEILVRIARIVVPPVVGGEIGAAADLAGEEAAAERAVGDEADAELAADGEDVVLHVAFPERIFGLQRGDRMDGGGAADRLGRRLRRGRCGGPCPPSPARPCRRSSPRSARWDRRGAGRRGRSCRCRAAAASLRRRGGHLPGCRRCRPAGCPSQRIANLVAMTRPSRLPLIASPTSSSLAKGPYISAVSKKVMPRSMARWMVAIDSSSVAWP